MTLLDAFWVRTAATLTATLTTVLIITERNRRIGNAKVELAARHLEMIEQECRGEYREQDVLRDLQLADALVQDAAWPRLARASKIEEVMHVTRKLHRIRHTYEKLDQDNNAAERTATITRAMADHSFATLADEVRKLRVSFIDFIFIHSTRAKR